MALLDGEMRRYVGETCPALAARCYESLASLPPRMLWEVAAQTRALESFTDETNQQLRAALAATAKDQDSVDALLDRALASLEHLNELALALSRRLDGLKMS